MNLFLLIIFGVSLNAFASSGQSQCPSVENAQELLNCALENHPKIIRARLSLSQASEQDGAAKQWLNPDLDSKAVSGTSLGDRIVETEVALTQTIELGGKRSSRIERAAAERASAEAILSLAKEQAINETLSNLIRLRQISFELEIVEEALHTFGTIGSQFRSRPRLTPDQQVSFGIFLLAEGDYKHKRSSLLSEQEEVRQTLYLAIGREVTFDKHLLPLPRAAWPDLTAKVPPGFRDGEFLTAQSELMLGQAEYEMSKAASWPDLKLGPVFQYKSEGGVSYPTFGVSLGFPLPLFSQNGGGRAYALKGMLKAEHSLSLLQLEKTSEQRILQTRYENAIKTLRESLSVIDIEKKHKNIESLFRQGLIGGPSVIEMHRQILDFTKSKHEQELLATQALIKIKAQQGTLTGGSIL